MKVHRRRTLTAIAAVGALIGAALLILPAQATPPSGVTTTPIATGRFGAIDTQSKTGAWKAKLQTKGASDLHVLQNTIAPGGTFGWHRHPGPSLVIVKSGRRRSIWPTTPPVHPTWSRPDQASWIRAATCTWCATRAASTW